MLKGRINKILFFLGIGFILFGIVVLVSSIILIDNIRFIGGKNTVYNLEKSNIENNRVNRIISNQDYKAILSIPKIGLDGKIYDINSEKNNVSKNIQVIETSNYPDVSNSNLILASHSGNSNVSYFTDLDKLEINDLVYLYYNNKKYTYKISDIYKQEKLGKINIIRNKNETNLTLITCDENDKKYQIVYISTLINVND